MPHVKSESMGLRLLLLLAAAMAPLRSHANEQFCSAIPQSKVHIKKKITGGQMALTVSVPREYRDAKFRYAQVQIGEGD